MGRLTRRAVRRPRGLGRVVVITLVAVALVLLGWLTASYEHVASNRAQAADVASALRAANAGVSLAAVHDVPLDENYAAAGAARYGGVVVVDFRVESGLERVVYDVTRAATTTSVCVLVDPVVLAHPRPCAPAVVAFIPPPPTTTLAPATPSGLLATYTLSGGPAQVALDTASGDLYVTEPADQALVELAPSGATLATIPLSGSPTGVAYDAATGLVVVSLAATNQLAFVDPRTRALAASVPVGRRPGDILYDPASGDVYVANHGAGTVSVVDPVTYRVLATLSVGDYPAQMAYDPATRMVYVAVTGANSVVAVTDAFTLGPSAIVGDGPAGLALDTRTGLIYVANTAASPATISVLDPTAYALRVTNTITLDLAAPTRLAVRPRDSQVAVTSSDATALAVVDGPRASATRLVAGAASLGVVYDPTTGDFYAALPAADRIVVFY